MDFDLSNERDVQRLMELDEHIPEDDDTFCDILKSLKTFSESKLVQGSSSLKRRQIADRRC